MEELRNESYKEYAVRNSNINFDDDKPIYVFYSEWNCEDSATTQEEFDAFWRTLSILSLIILIIVVMVYIVSVKVFKRTIGKTLLGVVILLTVNVIILVLTNETTVLIFVAAVLYIVYLVQTIVNIRKF